MWKNRPSYSGTQSRPLVLADSGTETDRLTGSQFSDWAASQKADTLARKLNGLEAPEILNFIEKGKISHHLKIVKAWIFLFFIDLLIFLVSFLCFLETGKKFSSTDRKKATEAVKKVIDEKKRARGRGIFAFIGTLIAALAFIFINWNKTLIINENHFK